MHAIEARSIGFTGLKVSCLIGVLPHEYKQTQEISISLKITLPQEVQREDLLSSTIDYSELAKLCQGVALRSHHGLIETLASCILEEILEHYYSSYLWIRIEKPSAIPEANCAFVEYEKRIPRP